MRDPDQDDTIDGLNDETFATDEPPCKSYFILYFVQLAHLHLHNFNLRNNMSDSFQWMQNYFLTLRTFIHFIYTY